jgi:hypothetical protein
MERLAVSAGVPILGLGGNLDECRMADGPPEMTSAREALGHRENRRNRVGTIRQRSQGGARLRRLTQVPPPPRGLLLFSPQTSRQLRISPAMASIHYLKRQAGAFHGL